MHMLPRGSQRQKRWRSHPPLPRQKKKEAKAQGQLKEQKRHDKAHPYSGWDRNSMYSHFSNTCMCYEGWDCILERKFVIIIKLLNCFIFSLEFGLCLQWKRRKEELFWRGFYGCNSPKVSYSS
jgi:hypothetical protein